MTTAGKFYDVTSGILVDAMRLKDAVIISAWDLPSAVSMEAGDWLIITEHGEPCPCTNEIFRRNYKPANDEARALWDDDAWKGGE